MLWVTVNKYETAAQVKYAAKGVQERLLFLSYYIQENLFPFINVWYCRNPCFMWSKKQNNACKKSKPWTPAAHALFLLMLSHFWAFAIFVNNIHIAPLVLILATLLHKNTS